ncbi:hypothetical protein [Pedobacter jejuensis]|uniref:Uncharacterized protein n=1 Tax=Pedobacter jejuensis TaxID=1268550 RepID=A0A3N0BUB3_9SPHI|nr:hypothetical protein [Pedobacter jejuensis]RNL52780.1 hypothetical protein D7004_10830 [Pedobacter jejuensis]
MFTNILSRNDFETTGVDCICQSINSLLQIWEIGNDFIKENGAITGITMSEFWDHHVVTVNTSFILLHQGMEALLKAHICGHSPMLLLEAKRNEWPTKPGNKHLDFSQFHQVGGESLFITFFATDPPNHMGKHIFYNLIEEIRTIRNKIVHVGHKNNIEVKDALSYALKILTYYFGKDKWLEFLRDRYRRNPVNINSVERIPYFWNTINFVWENIGKAECRKNLSLERQTRFYHCPSCSVDLDGLASHEEIKLSLLRPNDPLSTTVYCLICDREHDVIRQSCDKEACPGNVISVGGLEKICLTCFK